MRAQLFKEKREMEEEQQKLQLQEQNQQQHYIRMSSTPSADRAKTFRPREDDSIENTEGNVEKKTHTH
jgi:hypothetical protein